MNKKFIIRQCRRLDAIHIEESEELKQENNLNYKWILIHNEGHKELLYRFKRFLKDTNIDDKRIVKKWLRKNIKRSNNIIESLDEKYNRFDNDEIMDKEDEKIYNLNDGICCISYILIDIIDRRRYISKLK